METVPQERPVSRSCLVRLGYHGGSGKNDCRQRFDVLDVEYGMSCAKSCQ